MSLIMVLAVLSAAAPGPAIREESADFYGRWTIADSRRVAVNGDILPDREDDLTGKLVEIRRDGMTLPDGMSFSFSLDDCRNVGFHDRMWNDFGYMRLARYDLATIFKAFALPYRYDSLVYRIDCGDPALNDEINFPRYDGKSGGASPDNRSIPFDRVNFVFVDKDRFVLYDGDDWLLLKRVH